MALLATATFGLAGAQSPPQPDFFWPYGTVLQSGANIAPAQQPLIALVRGQACGFTETLVATAQPGNPPGDVGKTVYAVDVLADGAGAGQRPGCGRLGDPVTFYLPQIGRVASQQPLFQQGEQRVDLSAAIALGERLVIPVVSDDGPLQ